MNSVLVILSGFSPLLSFTTSVISFGLFFVCFFLHEDMQDMQIYCTVYDSAIYVKL